MFPDNSIERRSAPRCAIALQLVVDAHGSRHRAITRDLSIDGLSFLLPDRTRIEVGETVSFALVLQHVPDPPSRLEATAVVVRVDEEPGGMLLAVRAQWLSTLPAQSALAALKQV